VIRLGGLNNKAFRSLRSPGLFLSTPQLCKQACSFGVKKKALPKNREGFVVAGRGFEPLAFGL
jgi:hypothetical protein